MTGSVAQTISLISYGNEFLSNGNVDPLYFSKNSTFKYCNRVNFKGHVKPIFGFSREKVIASDPLTWFRYLDRNGCMRLKLFYQPSQQSDTRKDYSTAGLVGGGGTWAIEALYSDHASYWVDSWSVTDKDDPERRIWSVSYINTFSGPPVKSDQIDLKEARSTLEQALHEIIEFCEKSNFNGWIPTFQTAFDVLGSEHPEKDRYYTDCIVGNTYSLEARQVFFGATASWVFGGMGSWNDFYIENKQLNAECEHVSENLYSAMNQAFLASINSIG